MPLCSEAAVNFPNPLLDFATSLISTTSCDNDAEQKTAPKSLVFVLKLLGGISIEKNQYFCSEKQGMKCCSLPF